MSPYGDKAVEGFRDHCGRPALNMFVLKTRGPFKDCADLSSKNCRKLVQSGRDLEKVLEVPLHEITPGEDIRSARSPDCGTIYVVERDDQGDLVPAEVVERTVTYVIPSQSTGMTSGRQVRLGLKVGFKHRGEVPAKLLQSLRGVLSIVKVVPF